VFGDKESVEDLGASNIYVQMYSIICYEAVVVCVFDAGCALELSSAYFCQLAGETLGQTKLMPAPVSKTGRQLCFARWQGPIVAAIL